MIESADGTRERWRTVGVSANIIDASFNALHDGITWKLLHHGVDALPRVEARAARPRPAGASR
jgi:2-isopropylmalate synthase